jgi:endonuclease/exonuclease/phosphatase family metal-dependent hydrolase
MVPPEEQLTEVGFMVFYNRIDSNTTEGKRTAERLLKLKEALRREIPQRDIAGSLVLASWNIREFDSAAYGARKDEPLYYIAEIIDHFDLVAVQEVRDDLTALERLMDLLGWWWKYLLTDVTLGEPGNQERMAFLYDSRKVRFGGLAGEVVIPPYVKVEDGERMLEPAKQLARTPFITGFGIDWFKCMICTTHILYGESVAEDPERLEEIRVLAQFLADRTKEKHAWAKNMILLGDFNIFDTTDQTMQAILEAGFTIPQKLQGHPSNAPKTRHYDQIAFIAPELENRLELSEAGVFDYYRYVYREEDEALYAEEMGEAYLRKDDGTERTEQGRTTYYKSYWRTHQMSDHLPMWIELKTDFGEENLKDKAGIDT